MNKNTSPQSATPSSGKWALGYIAPLVIVFMLSFIPMWWKFQQASRHLVQVERQTTRALMQNALASAIIDALQDDYESARQSAGDFFTALRTEIDKEEDSAFSPAQIEAGRLLLVQRDEVITLLARGEPGAINWLVDLYNDYRELIR